MPLRDERPVVLLVDNSVSFTGAFKCALQQAQLMQDHFRYEFVLPEGSIAASFVLEQGMRVHALPIMEIKKQVLPILKYPFHLTKNAYRLNVLLRKRQAQVLIINDYYNLLGVAVRQLNKKIQIVTYVRLQPAHMPRLLNLIWVGFALRYTNLVIAVSDTVRSHLPVHPKVRLLYDAVAFTERYEKADEKGTKGTVSLIYLGNYIRGKGHDHALQAFAGAFRQNQNLRLSFYGGDMGLEKNRQFKKELQAFVAEHKLSSAVHFHPFVQDVEAAYRNADVFLNFSESESFSMTCAEAAFYGLPIIASRCGGPEEIIVQKETGILVANKDVDAMKNAILLLASERETRKLYGAAAATYVREKFSPNKYVQQLSALFKNLPNEVAR